MDQIPSEPTVSAHRSRKRALWIRGALTGALVLSALAVLLSREDPAIFGAARAGLFPVASPSPSSTQTAPTPSATLDLMALLPFLQQRSLRVSALAAGETCVTTSGKQGAPELGPALGDGPVYMVGYSIEGTTSYYNDREDGGWYYLKTIWTAPPNFHSIFLLRGRQMDGPNEVRFSEDTTDSPNLQAIFSSDEAGSEASGWLPWIDYVRVRAPGCYGIQVDGRDFSYIIHFRVFDTPHVPKE
jgi:hypothetical protein